MEDSKKINFIEKIKNFLNNKKTKYIVIACLCLIVVLIFLSSFSVGSNSVKKTQVSTESASLWKSYCTDQENRLTSVLESVKGIGTVKVYVMVDASPEFKYLENKSQSSSKEGTVESLQTTAVEVKNGTITQAVVVLERLPRITGILIVASGAKDVKMKNTLSNVVANIMNVNLSCVEVLEGK